MALPLYSALANVVGVAAQMARELDMPASVIAEYLDRLDAANEATISSPNARQMLGTLLAALKEQFGRDPG